MSTKRKALGEALGRRVRARREESEDLESVDSIQSFDKPRPAKEVDSTSESEGESEEEDEEDEQSVSEESEAPETAATISFGALAKAQATIAQPGKSKDRTKKRTGEDGWENNEALERKEGRKDRRDFNRSSKHAPTEISSKKAVSRKREVIPVPKREFRDPRFEPLATGSSSYNPNAAADESRVRAAYSFLDSYREDEMKELKTAIKNTKDEEAKEKLKRALMSMESRKKAQARKDKEAEILAKHRMEEKEMVKQGKQPFYLKKAEQKKRLLVEQFGELKGKQLDRVIERRRKKVEGKEKKKMPFARREVGS